MDEEESIRQPKVGDIICCTVLGENNLPVVRPAIVVQPWVSESDKWPGEGLPRVAVQIFMNGDGGHHGDLAPNVVWKEYLPYSDDYDDLFSWHWLPEGRTDEQSERQAKVGDIVAYVLSEGAGSGQVRPAIVVHNWRWAVADPGLLQLQVFTDGNDGLPAVVWQTSVPYDENRSPGTWHWL